MKKINALFIGLAVYSSGLAQFVAKMEVKEEIKGICNAKEVYALFPMFKGQVEAVCPLSKNEIEKRLAQEVTFLKDSVMYNDSGMVNIVINCKGEVVRCEMDNKTKSSELDKQIVVVFNSLGEWKPGRLNGNKVDTSRLWSFKIKNGQITLE